MEVRHLGCYELGSCVEWSCRRRAVALLSFKLGTYERLESVSLLELALWKIKIESFKAAYETDRNGTKQVAPRGLDSTRHIQMVLIGKAAESRAALMLSSPMCCLFWTKFTERTTLRRSLPFDLDMH